MKFHEDHIRGRGYALLERTWTRILEQGNAWDSQDARTLVKRLAHEITKEVVDVSAFGCGVAAGCIYPFADIELPPDAAEELLRAVDEALSA